MSELQDMLRVQARLHRKQGANALGDLFESAAKEINQYESALKEWIEKTEWVQNSANANELGVHRADALSLRISDLKSELAKANERVKRLEKIFSEAPDLTFDDVQSMFSEELNKFAIENQVKGIYLATNNVADNNDLSYLPAEVSLELCEQFAEQLRKEQ